MVGNKPMRCTWASPWNGKALLEPYTPRIPLSIPAVILFPETKLGNVSDAGIDFRASPDIQPNLMQLVHCSPFQWARLFLPQDLCICFSHRMDAFPPDHLVDSGATFHFTFNIGPYCPPTLNPRFRSASSVLPKVSHIPPLYSIAFFTICTYTHM